MVTDLNIVATNNSILPLLLGPFHAYKEALEWIQFTFTGYQIGAYVTLGSTDLGRTPITEGDPLFPLSYPTYFTASRWLMPPLLCLKPL